MFQCLASPTTTTLKNNAKSSFTGASFTGTGSFANAARRPILADRYKAPAKQIVRMGPPIPPNGAHIGHTMGGVPSAVKVHMTVYHDYTCPFSAKSYFMLFNQVAPHYGDKVAITFYHQVQPWHPQSSYCHEAALAVAHLNGNDAFFKFSDVLMQSQEEYYDINTYDLTRRQIYDKLGDLAQSVGVDKAKFMDLLALDAESIAKGSKNPGNQMTQNLKWEIKASRTMGMHVSPTTTINGPNIKYHPLYYNQLYYEGVL